MPEKVSFPPRAETRDDKNQLSDIAHGRERNGAPERASGG